MESRFGRCRFPSPHQALLSDSQQTERKKRTIKALIIIYLLLNPQFIHLYISCGHVRMKKR